MMQPEFALSGRQRKRGAGDREPGGSGSHGVLRSVQGWFRVVGRDGGSNAQSLVGCAGVLLTAKMGRKIWGRDVPGKGQGRAFSCFGVELVMA